MPQSKGAKGNRLVKPVGIIFGLTLSSIAVLSLQSCTMFFWATGMLKGRDVHSCVIFQSDSQALADALRFTADGHRYAGIQGECSVELVLCTEWPDSLVVDHLSYKVFDGNLDSLTAKRLYSPWFVDELSKRGLVPPNGCDSSWFAIRGVDWGRCCCQWYECPELCLKDPGRMVKWEANLVNTIKEKIGRVVVYSVDTVGGWPAIRGEALAVEGHDIHFEMSLLEDASRKQDRHDDVYALRVWAEPGVGSSDRDESCLASWLTLKSAHMVSADRDTVLAVQSPEPRHEQKTTEYALGIVRIPYNIDRVELVLEVARRDQNTGKETLPMILRRTFLLVSPRHFS